MSVHPAAPVATPARRPTAPFRAQLERLAPHLVAGFDAALPGATTTVAHRLLAAAVRERLTPATWSGDLLRLPTGEYPAQGHGFGRVELSAPVPVPPELLLARLGIHHAGLAEELADARINLALARARRAGIDAELRARARRAGAADLIALAVPLPADEQMLLYERLATDGHNLHPCGRTRLGWSVADLLAHDQESPATTVGFVAVHRDAHRGDDIGALLRDAYPWLPAPPAGYLLQPVHAWQLGSVLASRYGPLFESGVLRPVPGAVLRAAPTTALRTVLLEPDAHGVRRYLKLSLDIQVTSTRRTVSAASTRNGPAISALLHHLLDGDPGVLLLPEPAGAALDGPARDLSAIVRGGLTGRLGPGEVAVPAAALTATSPLTGRSVLAELLARYPGPPGDFLAAYARILLAPVLRLAARGVGLEAHLQNSIPTFVDGVPHRIAVRDFAGLRLHLPRLRARAGQAGRDLTLWPGSVIGTTDVGVLRAKIGYTALQAHLGEIVLALARAQALPEPAGWRRIRDVLDEARERGDTDADDHAFLTAPRMPHKALVRMRLATPPPSPAGAGGPAAGAAAGDIYLPVDNPLHDP